MSELPTRRAPRFVFLTDLASAPHGGRFAWRLDAANNRRLARSLHVEHGLDACRNSARALHAGLANAAARVVLERVGGLWGWRLAEATDAAGAPVTTDPDDAAGRAGAADAGATAPPTPLGARSIHPYLRRVECVRGFAQFVEAVALADPDAGVVRSFGPRTLQWWDAPAAAPSTAPAGSPA